MPIHTNYANIEDPANWQGTSDIFKKPEKPDYIYNTESRVWRIAKKIFSIIVFPVGLYQLAHTLTSYPIVLSRMVGIFSRSIPGESYAADLKNGINPREDFTYKRVSIVVDENTIDAMIIRPVSVSNNRWTLFSGGNCEFYENKLNRHSPYNLYGKLKKLNSSAILYNYPGVGESKGSLDRKTLAKTYRAMLKFLEEEQQADEIIGIGHSLGGAVQGEGLKDYKLNHNISYVFVKKQTFSELSIAASGMIHRIAGIFIRLIGWNQNNVESSKKLEAPEIIIQTVRNNEKKINASVYFPHYEIENPSDLEHDGVISENASLAKALLENKITDNKTFIGIQEDHNSSIGNYEKIANLILNKLAG